MSSRDSAAATPSSRSHESPRRPASSTCSTRAPGISPDQIYDFHENYGRPPAALRFVASWTR